MSKAKSTMTPTSRPEPAFISPPATVTLERKKTGAKADAPAPAEPKGKVAALVALLMRPEGATIEALQQASGWQAHSVRGAISGSIKKKLGLTVSSEKAEGGRVYRIAKGA